MEKLIVNASTRQSTDKGLIDEYRQYESMLKQEDGDNVFSSPKTLRLQCC